MNTTKTSRRIGRYRQQMKKKKRSSCTASPATASHAAAAVPIMTVMETLMMMIVMVVMMFHYNVHALTQAVVVMKTPSRFSTRTVSTIPFGGGVGSSGEHCHVRNILSSAYGHNFLSSSYSATTRTSTSTRLFSAYDPEAAYEGSDDDDAEERQQKQPQGSENEGEHTWEEEETLLAMHLAPSDDVSIDDAFNHVSKYVQSFPFAAVLPVQPLQYLPRDDGGVELQFLRKKTHIKPGVDGGIRFFIAKRSSETDTGEEGTGAVDDIDGGLDVTAKRNSSGQSLSKIFAEKLVVTTFVQGVLDGAKMKATAETNDSNESSDGVVPPKTRIESPTASFVTTMSVFHKWM